MTHRTARYTIGQIVKHKHYAFRGVVFDVDPIFSNTDEWWDSIPKDIRPAKDQPYYHLLAENAQSTYVAYVSEQNLLADKNPQPIDHPQVDELFENLDNGVYHLRDLKPH